MIYKTPLSSGQLAWRCGFTLALLLTLQACTDSGQARLAGDQTETVTISQNPDDINTSDNSGDDPNTGGGTQPLEPTVNQPSGADSPESSGSNTSAPPASSLTNNNADGPPVPSDASAPVQPVFPDNGIPDDAPPLAEVTTTPPDVDPNTNRAPYFEGLDDQVVYAGQFMEMRLVPRDPDGTVPGLFTGPLPDGAQNIDNFDGTKTIRWRPLEPQVGTIEIDVTAVDAEAPMYRTSRTVRVRIRMPDDRSTIINLPPSINQVNPHTARAGDEIVILVKAEDPNGYVPELELLSSLQDFSFTRLEEDERIKVLRWQTRDSDIGFHYLNFRATDIFDANLIHERTIEIELRGASSFVRPGTRLRDAASAQNIYIGYASLLAWYNRPDGMLYGDIAGEEFNIVTTENSVKWGVVNPEPNVWEWEAFDAEMQLAYRKDMLVHGHPLLWHRQLPAWIQRLPVAEREQTMLDFIAHVAGRYSDRVAVWDVVNEAFEDDGSYRYSVWFEAMGNGYIEKAFRQARISAPNSQLVYNDYDVAWEGPKADAMYDMLREALENDVPIDGVGFQMHIDAGFDQFDSVRRNFQRFADLGLDIYITEFDVAIRQGESLERQADVYRQALSICLEQAACRAFQTWGFTDRYSWIRDTTPLLFDRDYNAKTAYFALQERLLQNP